MLSSLLNYLVMCGETKPESSLIPEVFVDHAGAEAVDRAVAALLVVLNVSGRSPKIANTSNTRVGPTSSTQAEPRSRHSPTSAGQSIGRCR